MEITRAILGIAILAVTAVPAAAFGQSGATTTNQAKPVECISGPAGFSPPFATEGQHCRDPNCTECEAEKGSWMSRSSRSLRRWWHRKHQRKKGLHNPEYAPLYEPNWGYHPTCWRKFPPIVCPCPPANPGLLAPGRLTNPPSPTASRMNEVVPDRVAAGIVDQTKVSAPEKSAWQPSRRR